MEVVIKDATGLRGRTMTKKQFKFASPHFTKCMQQGKRIKDTDVLDLLVKAGDPIDFLPSVLMEVALYEDAPHVPFLGAWLGSDVERSQEAYDLARAELSKDEFSLFDMATSVETQRTFLYLLAYAEGARIPR